MTTPLLDELVAAYLGAESSEERRAELLARLDADPDLRRRFAEALHLRALIQLTRTGDPRWPLLEGEWGEQRPLGRLEPHEERLLARLDFERRRVVRRRWMLAAAAAGCVALAAGAARVWGVRRGGGAPAAPFPPEAFDSVLDPVSVLVRAEGVRWRPGAPAPNVGDLLAGGRLEFEAGRLTLALVNGVTLSAEGPADLDLRSPFDVRCLAGGLRAAVPPGAEGFTVRTPVAVVIDRGTEFGVNVAADGRSEVRVFRGSADLALLDPTDRPTRQETLPLGKTVQIDVANGKPRFSTAVEGRFTPLLSATPAPLPLGPDYRDLILASRPWAYWRLDRMVEGRAPNSVPDGPALAVHGGVGADVNRHGVGAAVFAPGAPGQYLLAVAPWTPPRRTGAAVEFWFLADSYHQATLAGLLGDDASLGHAALVELSSVVQGAYRNPLGVRGLDRWPPGRYGGDNLTTAAVYHPNRWHHVVAQRKSGMFQLFLDGVESAVATEADDATGPVRPIFGRLLAVEPENVRLRPFVGRLAEIALYDRCLTTAEVGSRCRVGRSG